MFGAQKTKKEVTQQSNRLEEFHYLDQESIYMDAACQSMRPQPVIDALRDYYENYNACGGRVKYQWGQKVDEQVAATRANVLRYLGCSSKEYTVSFTLNTTMGLNMLLQQLPSDKFKRVVTSDIEHNSVFLPTMTLSKRLNIERVVLERSLNGEISYEPKQLDGAIVVVNATSNIDGRTLNNIKQFTHDVHKQGGIVVIDAAQAMAHNHEMLKNTGVDAICFSGHKLYSASLGVVVAKKSLLQMLDITIVGGGMVGSVTENSFNLVHDDLASRLEPGLQAWGEIIALNESIKWLQKIRPNGIVRHAYIDNLSQILFEGLQNMPGLTVINESATPVISCYSKNIDAHRMAIFLSSAGIMVRSGYFCCHYFLEEKMKMPPLLRFSIGLHNTEQDIKKTLSVMKTLTGKA